jgi:hypothetical protein
MKSKNHTMKHGSNHERKLTKEYVKALKEYNRAKLQALDVDSIYKLEEAKAKKNKCRNASIRESSRNEKHRKKEYGGKDEKSTERGKNQHHAQHDQASNWGKTRDKIRRFKAVKATMDFEGFKSEVDTEEGIKNLMSCYTELVSIDEKTPKDKIIQKLELHDKNLTKPKQGHTIFDDDFNNDMEDKYKSIQSELEAHKHGDHHMDRDFSKREMKQAIKHMKKSLYKSRFWDENQTLALNNLRMKKALLQPLQN